jgi:membrane-associated phospholipid phosphatase
MKHYIFRAAGLFFGVLFCLFTHFNVQASDSIEFAGNILDFLLPATTTGFTLGFKDYKGTLQFAESTALAAGATSGLKSVIDEKRPNGGIHSFPSGHASIAFASAEFMRKRYGWEYGIPAYAVASFVAYSRVEAKKHYVHDVLAGAVIGIGSSYLFTQPYKGWHIQAETDGQYYGIGLSCTW